MKSVILFFVIFCKLLLHFGVTNVVNDIYSKLHQNEYNVTFERVVIHYINKSLIECDIKSFVYNRTMKATNATFLLYDEYTNEDLRVLIVAKKFLSNEYRPFPIRFETNGCKTWDENIGGLATSISCGNFTGCPIKKNTKYFICNNIVDSTHFPPLVPTGQYLIELSFLGPRYTFLTLHSFINIQYKTKLAPISKSKSG